MAKWTGTNDSKAVSLAAEAARRGRLAEDRGCPWQESRLALTARLGEAGSATRQPSPVRRDAQPAFPGGFCFVGSGLAASREWSRARGGFRAQRKRPLSG